MSEILRESAFFGAALTIIAFDLANRLAKKLKNPLCNPPICSRSYTKH